MMSSRRVGGENVWRCGSICSCAATAGVMWRNCGPSALRPEISGESALKTHGRSSGSNIKSWRAFSAGRGSQPEPPRARAAMSIRNEPMCRRFQSRCLRMGWSGVPQNLSRASILSNTQLIQRGRIQFKSYFPLQSESQIEMRRSHRSGPLRVARFVASAL